MKHTPLDHICMFIGQRRHTRKRIAGDLTSTSNPYQEGMERTFTENFDRVTWGEKSEGKTWIIGNSGGGKFHPDVPGSHYVEPLVNGTFYAEYNPKVVKHWDGTEWPRDIAVSKINTSDSFRQQYGRIQFRCTLPKDKATWAAWWMHALGWLPEMGFEEVEGEHGLVKCYMIWKEGNKIVRTKQIIRVEEENEAKLHLYAINWTKNRITMEIDGEEVFRMSKRRIVRKFHKPLHLVINTDIKLDLIEDVEKYSSVFIADFIRVYQKNKS